MRIRHSVKRQVVNAIPPLVEHLGDSQVLPVLMADYQAKVLRLEDQLSLMAKVGTSLIYDFLP